MSVLNSAELGWTGWAESRAECHSAFRRHYVEESESYSARVQSLWVVGRRLGQHQSASPKVGGPEMKYLVLIVIITPPACPHPAAIFITDPNFASHMLQRWILRRVSLLEGADYSRILRSAPQPSVTWRPALCETPSCFSNDRDRENWSTHAARVLPSRRSKDQLPGEKSNILPPPAALQSPIKKG